VVENCASRILTSNDTGIVCSAFDTLANMLFEWTETFEILESLQFVDSLNRFLPITNLSMGVPFVDFLTRYVTYYPSPEPHDIIPAAFLKPLVSLLQDFRMGDMLTVRILKFIRVLLLNRPNYLEIFSRIDGFETVLSFCEFACESFSRRSACLSAVFAVIDAFMYVDSSPVDPEVARGIYALAIEALDPGEINVLNSSVLSCLCQTIFRDDLFAETSEGVDFASGIYKIIRMTDTMASTVALDLISLITQRRRPYFDIATLVNSFLLILRIIARSSPADRDLLIITVLETMSVLADDTDGAMALIQNADLMDRVIDLLAEGVFGVRQGAIHFLAVMLQMVDPAPRRQLLRERPEVVEAFVDFLESAPTFVWWILAVLAHAMEELDKGDMPLEGLGSLMEGDILATLLGSPDVQIAAHARWLEKVWAARFAAEA
jgi:hypothetical protein